MAVMLQLGGTSPTRRGWHRKSAKLAGTWPTSWKSVFYTINYIRTVRDRHHDSINSNRFLKDEFYMETGVQLRSLPTALQTHAKEATWFKVDDYHYSVLFFFFLSTIGVYSINTT